MRRRECTGLEPSNLDLLELQPAARMVRLQLDAAGFEVLQTVVLEDGLPVDSHQAAAVLHDELEQEPLLRFDARIDRPFERIERPGRVVRAFDVVQLDLVAADRVPSGLSAPTETSRRRCDAAPLERTCAARNRDRSRASPADRYRRRAGSPRAARMSACHSRSATSRSRRDRRRELSQVSFAGSSRTRMLRKRIG